jgi:hypothetical protein
MENPSHEEVKEFECLRGIRLDVAKTFLLAFLGQLNRRVFFQA